MNLKNLPCGFNAARGFVGGATYMALCMGMAKDLSFNAARGFVGGAARNGRRQARPWPQVSMPHAALWVVQHRRSQLLSP